ncbi:MULTISPECIES: hypothetical protein [unclassified Rhizobium]|uniref:hypothetical protein n=1 Tax=unclassified Rhizobium TaxID=2613769 RepID=UPI00105080E4|nr:MULTISPECIES: hypothetical protein [unclassified Rhizobium]MBB3396658.1 hypothetical protein [Rhizobium sp. BK060]MBB4166714.1 hypothetical protein [Rhizobium sp. BK538]TCM77443.1 hypothetical protein EV291_10784 [Rhizobium sp. BK068]
MKSNRQTSQAQTEATVVASVATLARVQLEALANHKVETSDDPISTAIEAFRAGNAAFCATKEEDWPAHGGEEAVIANTYGRPLEVLENWDQPALSLKGAVDALRFANEENRNFESNPTVVAMVGAALAYLEKATAVSIGSGEVTLAGATPGSAVPTLLSEHRSAFAAGNEHWQKCYEVQDGIEELLPNVRVRVGTLHASGGKEDIWAYSENDVLEKTERHIRAALNEFQRTGFMALRDKFLTEIRDLQQKENEIKEGAGLNALEATGRELDAAHRDIFSKLISERPATLEEARAKVSYIADHLDEMGEAMDEEEATKLLRDLL